MHPLVRAVLLGTGRLRQLGPDPELDPPYRQAREPPKSRRSERNSVVASDGLGQSVFPKQPLEALLHAVCLRREQPFASDKVSPLKSVAQSSLASRATVLRAGQLVFSSRPEST